MQAGSAIPSDAAFDTRRHILRFSGGIMACALLFQRFGFSTATAYLDIVSPLGLLLVGWALVAGVFVFSSLALRIYLAMCFLTFTSTIMSSIDNSGYGPFSPPALLQFLALGSCTTLRFTEPVNEVDFFRTINWWIAIISIAGLIEFFLQFVGLELFSFTTFVPERFLVEAYWNVTIPIDNTPYFKSNGFFLLEPSILSQFVGLALIIEILLLRRTRYLCLFGAALVASVSGTGWLMIISFILTTVFSLGAAGVLVSVATIGVAALALGGLAFADPEIYLFLISRTAEFQLPGTSAFLRFVTPWWFALDVLKTAPLTAVFGIGAGLSDHVAHMPAFDYNVNSVVKLFIEFGAPTLVTFLALFFTGRRTRVQNALIAPIMVWILSDGTYVQTPFILFPAVLLLVTARLEQTAV